MLYIIIICDTRIVKYIYNIMLSVRAAAEAAEGVGRAVQRTRVSGFWETAPPSRKSNSANTMAGEKRP